MSARETFPQRLKALREAIGIIQEDFAKRLGVSRPTISYYEKGDRIPDIDFLDRLHSLTGCSVAYLLGYSDSMKEENAPLRAETGLSDKAIDILKREDINIEVVNYIIEHNLFRLLLDSFQALPLYLLPEYSTQTYFGGRNYVYYAISRVSEEIAKDYAENCKMEKHLEDAYLKGPRLRNMALARTNEIIEASRNLTSTFSESFADLISALKRADQRMEEEDPVYRFYKRMHAQNSQQDTENS